MSRIIVEVQGGSVIAVYSDTEVSVTVVDRDVDGVDDTMVNRVFGGTAVLIPQEVEQNLEAVQEVEAILYGGGPR